MFRGDDDQRLGEAAGLGPIIAAVYEGLNRRGECRYVVDDANTMHLKLYPQLPLPAPLRSYEVPVRTRDLDVLATRGTKCDRSNTCFL
jgi:hypothetical protein